MTNETCKHCGSKNTTQTSPNGVNWTVCSDCGFEHAASFDFVPSPNPWQEPGQALVDWTSF